MQDQDAMIANQKVLMKARANEVDRQSTVMEKLKKEWDVLKEEQDTLERERDTLGVEGLP